MKKPNPPRKNVRAARWTWALRPNLKPASLLSSALLLLGVQAPAATYYWDHAGTSAGSWGTLGEWSTAASPHTAPAALPGAGDFAIFGGAQISGGHNVNFSNNRSIQGMQFTTIRNLTLQSGTTGNFTLSLGSSGIQMDSGAGILSINSTIGLNLTGSQSWVNDSTKSLIVSNATGSPPISTNAAGTVLTLGGSGPMQINRSITNGSGSMSLVKNGTGDVSLGRFSTYTGTTNVSAGTLYAGSFGIGGTGSGLVTVASGGTIAGGGYVSGPFTVQSGGRVQTGDSLAASDISALNFDGTGAMDFQSGSITTLGLDPTAANAFSLTSDKLAFTGTSGSLNFDGDLTVTAPGFTPSAPATFDLLDWAGGMTSTFNSRFLAGSYSGLILGNGDDNLGFDLPDVSSSGYGWDISNLATNGTISLASVPEPGVTGLLALCLLGLTLRRRA